jgi:hypothetical protein
VSLSKSRNFPPFIVPEVHYCDHKNPPLVPVVSHINLVHAFLTYSLILRGPFGEFVDSPYYSESELCGGAVTVSFSKHLPWQAMHLLQRSTHFSKTCCRPLITSKFLASELPFHGWKSPEIAWGVISIEFCVRFGKSGSLEPHYNVRHTVQISPLLYPQGKSPWYPLDRSPGGPQSHSGCGGEEKKFPAPAGNRTLEPRSSSAIPTELSRLLQSSDRKLNIDFVQPPCCCFTFLSRCIFLLRHIILGLCIQWH